MSQPQDRFSDESVESSEFTSESAEHGIEAILDGEQHVVTLFLDPAVCEELPLGLDKSLSPSQLVDILGLVDSANPEQDVPPFGRVGAWYRWLLDFGYLHIEFAVGGGTITRVTLMTHEKAP